MGLPGKHPANVCQNKHTDNCHNCGGMCSMVKEDNCATDAELVANITKQVMAQLGLK